MRAFWSLPEASAPGTLPGMANLIFKFDSVQDAEKVDLMRVGPIAGRSGSGKVVSVEPDIEPTSAVGTSDDPDLNGFMQGVWAGLAAAGIFVEIERDDV